MGGGGGGSKSFGDKDTLDELVEKAKKEIERAKTRRKSVFISFSFEDIDEVNLLRAHAKNARSEIEFIDRSLRAEIDSERAAYIKQRLVERIRQASVTVVYLSPNSAASPWVKWEVEKSLELGKRVIAVHKGDIIPSPKPAFLTQNGITTIPWKQLPDHLSD